MRFAQRLFMGIGAVALAGTLISLVAPKAAPATVAALVEVANTSANPVPNADVNAPGEEPFRHRSAILLDPSRAPVQASQATSPSPLLPPTGLASNG